MKSEERIVKYESSVSKDTATFADANAGSFVRDFLEIEGRPKSMAAILAYAFRKKEDETLVAADVSEMARRGYLIRLPNGDFVLGPTEP
jgi:hypothetical protein